MKVQGIFNSGMIDTDKMSDVEAEIFEKQKELCDLAQKYDIPLFSLMFGPNPLLSQHFSLNNLPKQDLDKRLSKWLGIINGHIIRLTQGKLEILPSELKDYLNKPEDRSGEEWQNE
jgi:hypothetical protein